MARKTSATIVDLLQEEGLLSKRQRKQVGKAASRSDRSPVDVLLDEGFMAPQDLEGFMKNLGFPCVKALEAEVAWETVERITKEEALRVPVLPLVTSEGDMQIATGDPLDTELAIWLSEVLDSSVALVFAFPTEIRSTLKTGPKRFPEMSGKSGKGGFGDFIADETSYRVVEILRAYAADKTKWQKPLLIVGVGCVGKTFLARAVHQEMSAAFPDLFIEFVDGKTMTEDHGMPGGGRLPEGFILDGLEHIAGDPRSEEVFMQVFNAVFQLRGPIIVTVGKPLSALDELSTRVKASLAISQTVSFATPRPETQEAVGRQAAVALGIDPDAIDWVALISEAQGDLRRILEAVESGTVALSAASAVSRKAEQAPLRSTAPSEQPAVLTDASSSLSDTLHEEAEAIIEEARLAIEEIDTQASPDIATLLVEARQILEKAIEARNAGNYVVSEQLGMEALEKAAVAHGKAEKRVTVSPQKSDKVAGPKKAMDGDITDAEIQAIFDDVEKAIREACEMGAEEYASKELRVSVNGLEEAKRLLSESGQIGKALDEARLAIEQARDASRRARTRKEEARIKQEKEKIRRCQLAIDEARSEFDQIMSAEGDTPIAKQLEEVEVFIETAVQYQEVGNIGQALEHVMKARKRLTDVGQEATFRKELREIITEVDLVVRSADGGTQGHNPQQLVDIQSALAEAERVLMGDSRDYELGLNWARVARQKALRLTEGQTAQPASSAKSEDMAVPDKAFETYEICEANQFVAAIARTAAETPHLVKSPLYIHGEVGVGKTHLLAAIDGLARKTHPEKTVVFTTSSDFADEYREAAARSEVSAFRDRMKGVSILIIDDLHRVVSDRDGLHEFFHTMSAVEALGGLIIVSALVPPRRLEIDDRSFRSRLEGGVIAEVKNPTVSARERILRREATRYDFVIPDEAINLLATMITTNVRDLLGALGKVAAQSRASGGSVTGDIVRAVLRDVLPTTNGDNAWRLS